MAHRAGGNLYLRYPLSYRDLEETLRERDFEVDPQYNQSLGSRLRTDNRAAAAEKIGADGAHTFPQRSRRPSMMGT